MTIYKVFKIKVLGDNQAYDRKYYQSKTRMEQDLSKEGFKLVHDVDPEHNMRGCWRKKEDISVPFFGKNKAVVIDALFEQVRTVD